MAQTSPSVARAVGMIAEPEQRVDHLGMIDSAPERAVAVEEGSQLEVDRQPAALPDKITKLLGVEVIGRTVVPDPAVPADHDPTVWQPEVMIIESMITRAVTTSAVITGQLVQPMLHHDTGRAGGAPGGVDRALDRPDPGGVQH
jgi:hypothetical protein